MEIFVNSPYYCIQPMRSPIDLEQPDEQIWAFVEEHARKQKKFRLREDWLQEMKAKMAATADKRRREFQSR